MFHATSLGLIDAGGSLTGSCGDNPGIACRLAWDLTHSANATQVVRVYLAGPVYQGLRIAFVIVLALFFRYVLHRVINRLTERAATALLPGGLGQPCAQGGRGGPPGAAPSGASSGPGPSGRSCAAGSPSWCSASRP